MSVPEILHLVGQPESKDEAVTFRVSANGVESGFAVSREVLEDLAQTEALGPDEYVDEFFNHEGVILEAAARALAAGYAPGKDGLIVLGTNTIFS